MTKISAIRCLFLAGAIILSVLALTSCATGYVQCDAYGQTTPAESDQA